MDEVKLRRVPQQMAQAFLRSGDVVIHAVCATNNGGGACMPCLKLDAFTSDRELGAAISTVLSQSAAVAIPEDFDQEFRRVLKAAGCSSWRRLSDGAVCCTITAKDGQLTVLPTKKSKGSFLHLPNAAVSVEEHSAPEAIGSAVRDAWNMST